MDDLTYWRWCLKLLQDFQEGIIPPMEACTLYQRAFLDRPGMMADDEYEILNEVFLDFEDYMDDEFLEPGEVLKPGDLDLPELRRRMAKHARDLAALIARTEAADPAPGA